MITKWRENLEQTKLKGGAMQTNLKSQIAARMGADRKFYQVTKIVATATAIFIPSSVKSQDLIVNGDGVFTGALASTEIQTSDLLVLGGATVAGPVSVAGVADMNSLTVNEEAIIAGALSVDGPTRMQTLNVTGSSQLANTNVTGDAAISGAVSVSGESSLSNATVQGISLFKDLQTLKPRLHFQIGCL
ncbi:hypothetical protein ACFSHQ_24160 [Gemmobacter lanyuensis]